MIRYTTHDASIPSPKLVGKIAILHIVNDIGLFGGGFSGVLQSKYPTVAEEYEHANLSLGEIFVHKIHEDLCVVSMCAQHLVCTMTPKPLRPDALATCLARTSQVLGEGWSWQMPRIGCGLARGNWEIDVLPILTPFSAKREILVCDLM